MAMKIRLCSLFQPALVFALTGMGGVHAQTTWTGSSGGEWGTAANWDSGVPNATGSVANINLAHTVNVSDTGTAGTYPYTFGTLSTAITSGSVTIGSTSTTADILRAAVSAGAPVVNVTNSNANIFFYANLEGTQGFNKTGAGKFTFRFNGADQTYSGNLTISAGILGIEKNSSLGDDNNDITIANGSRLLAEPGSNSGTITLPSSRVITLTGAQSQIGANAAAVNLVINGNVTEDAAGRGLVKTDAGRVTLAGSLSYTGETRIAGGTLALAGSAALPSAQNLRFTGTTGTLDTGGTAQNVRTIVMDNTAGNKTVGGGGSLLVNGDANLQLAANNGVTYDFSGLNSFTFDRAARQLNIQTVNAASVTALMDVNLAKSGPGGGVNTITASQLLVGGGNSDGNNGNTARLHLGTTNTINATTIQVGGFNAGGVIDFQSGLTTPTLTVRATDGTSAVTTWKIGETSSGTRRGEGVVNLAGGSLDALVTNLQMGRHISNANLNDTSSLTMNSGTLVAQSITMAEKTGNGTPTLTTTLNQGGGSVTTGVLTLGVGSGGQAARLLPTYNLAGGTLRATTINATGATYAANSERNLLLAGGTLRNASASDLTINGLDTTAAGRINVNVTASSTVHADAGQSVVLAANALLTGGGNLAKAGGGSLVVNGTASTFTGTLAVNDGTLAGSTVFGGAIELTGGDLAPGNSIGVISAASLVWNGGSGMSFELSNVDGTSDALFLSGAFTRGSAGTYFFDFNGTGLLNETYTLVTFASTNFNVGDFGYTNLGGGYTGNFGLSGGNLTFTVVPEPSTALLGALAALGMLRRRRR